MDSNMAMQAGYLGNVLGSGKYSATVLEADVTRTVSNLR